MLEAMQSVWAKPGCYTLVIHYSV